MLSGVKVKDGGRVCGRKVGPATVQGFEKAFDLFGIRGRIAQQGAILRVK